MAERLYRFVALAALALWIGGTTFYAAIVVPIGSRLFGSVEQGLITEQVTGQLNWLGVVCLAILLPTVRQSRGQAVSWLLLVLTLAALFVLHPRIAAFIDHSQHVVTDRAAFYEWHRAYLLTTALQWLAGLVALWQLSSILSGAGRRVPGPQPFDMRRKNMACK